MSLLYNYYSKILQFCVTDKDFEAVLEIEPDETRIVRQREDLRVLGPSPISVAHITDKESLLDIIARHLANFEIPKHVRNNALISKFSAQVCVSKSHYCILVELSSVFAAKSSVLSNFASSSSRILTSPTFSFNPTKKRY